MTLSSTHFTIQKRVLAWTDGWMNWWRDGVDDCMILIRYVIGIPSPTGMSGLQEPLPGVKSNIELFIWNFLARRLAQAPDTRASGGSSCLSHTGCFIQDDCKCIICPTHLLAFSCPTPPRHALPCFCPSNKGTWRNSHDLSCTLCYALPEGICGATALMISAAMCCRLAICM